mmetsp:Transcript_29695/g.50754  ORF Transcript_29695/g.50754 Transcript_29695/m.50754 type:complete len:207 (+) Transcript_29695:106-726(+)
MVALETLKLTEQVRGTEPGQSGSGYTPALLGSGRFCSTVRHAHLSGAGQAGLLVVVGDELLGKRASESDDVEGGVLARAAAHVSLLRGGFLAPLQVRVHLARAILRVEPVEHRPHVALLEVLRAAALAPELVEDVGERLQRDERGVALDDHLAAVLHRALDALHQLRQALEVVLGLQPADALVQLAASLAGADRAVRQRDLVGDAL